MEFSLGGDRGLVVFRPGFPAVQPIDCGSGEPIGPPSPAVEADPLDYHANKGLYDYFWDLGPLGNNGCVALLLGFDDGTTHEAWLAL